MPIDATTGGEAANSYATLADFQAYADMIGFDYSAHDSATQDVALIRACHYLERGYRGMWRGVRASRAQSLAWPRDEVCDSDGYDLDSTVVPSAIRAAQFEATILSLGGETLNPSISRADLAVSSSVGAGPATISETFAPGASARTRYTAIEGLLSDFVTGHPGSTVSTRTIRR